MASDRMLMNYHIEKAKISQPKKIVQNSIDAPRPIKPTLSLTEISHAVADHLNNLKEVKENDKIYIGADKKIYKDGFGLLQPIMRTLLFRNRYTTIEQLEKLFKSYFLVMDNVFLQEKENEALMAFHSELVDTLINGLGNLKFTYEDSRSFVARSDCILLRLFYIKKILVNEKYKREKVRCLSSEDF